jgi:nicotinate (nicotinamide) nucleotide adenylyltransferase
VLHPEFVEFVQGFNFRVTLDAKRTTHVQPTLNTLKLLANRPSVQLFVYFGSFDPVHENHAALVSALDPSTFVVVIPNRGDNKTKQSITDYSHRVMMLKLRLEGLANVQVYETNDVTEAWSAKERIANEVGEQLFKDREQHFDLHLILGEDSFRKATTWKKSGISRLACKFIVFPREGTQLDTPKELIGRVAVVSDHKDPYPNLSSTKLRRVIGTGHDDIAGLDPRVLAYAREHKLYQNETDELFPDSEDASNE